MVCERICLAVYIECPLECPLGLKSPYVMCRWAAGWVMSLMKTPGDGAWWQRPF